MSRSLFAFAAFLSVLVLVPQRAVAQSAETKFQAGIHVAAARSGQFDKTDLGIGGLLSWQPGGLFGAEAELTFYPSDFPDEPAFSGSRVEGLFGVTIGPRLGTIRPFVKIRPGFVRYAEAPEPFACIAIFPPPLSCQLAAGHTAFALDIGGGLEFQTTARTFVRVDASDRAVKYPGPAISGDGDIEDEDFYGHDFRFQIGGGVRF